jgi:hypothetical protein
MPEEGEIGMGEIQYFLWRNNVCREVLSNPWFLKE